VKNKPYFWPFGFFANFAKFSQKWQNLSSLQSNEQISYFDVT
jgi:hypothetical protein